MSKNTASSGFRPDGRLQMAEKRASPPEISGGALFRERVLAHTENRNYIEDNVEL
jgi:hypothetical protein